MFKALIKNFSVFAGVRIHAMQAPNNVARILYQLRYWDNPDHQITHKKVKWSL